MGGDARHARPRLGAEVRVAEGGLRVPSTWMALEALEPNESAWMDVQIATTKALRAEPGSRPRFGAGDAEKCQGQETQKEQPGVWDGSRRSVWVL